jgi:parallel beta-helix repeat protein
MCSPIRSEKWNAYLLRIVFATGIVAAITAAELRHAAADTIRIPQDQKTIQAGIDAAACGDTVLVDKGTYKERIRLKPGITVKSAGGNVKGKLGIKRAETTIIDGSVGATKESCVVMAEDSTFDGFTVTGLGTYDDALWRKHYATQGEEQSHEQIGESGAAGIIVIGITHCTVSNNIVHHNGATGIAIIGAKDKRVSPRIVHNISYRNMGGGIGSMQQSTGIIEENLCFENFYAGIGHNNASPLVINNACYENIRAGIGISEQSKPIVRGNKCYRNRRAGIGIRTSTETRPIVENNECYENGMAGIGTRQYASPIIRNNRCYKNKLAGIGSRTHATPVIIGNDCFENGLSGIGQESEAMTLLIDNHCHQNMKAGIGFGTCKTGRSTVINNRVIDNAAVAIGINSGWVVHLSANELSRKEGLPPIVMVHDGADATFTDNIIRGGGVAGIRAAGKIRVLNNEFVGTSLRKSGPPNNAIWALSGSVVTLTANKIHGWRHGLHATEASVSANKNTVSNFSSSAFVIQSSTSPNNIHDNIAISQNPNDKAVSISGDAGIVNNNKLVGELNQ